MVNWQMQAILVCLFVVPDHTFNLESKLSVMEQKVVVELSQWPEVCISQDV